MIMRVVRLPARGTLNCRVFLASALLDRMLKEADLVAYIKQETLSHAIVEGIPAEAYKETHKIEGREITLGVKR